MAWYSTGTVNVVNGSTTVNATGTSFIDNVDAGEALLAPDGKLYEIAAVTSMNSLSLASPYLGATANSQSYTIVPVAGYTRSLARNTGELVSNYSLAYANRVISVSGRTGDVTTAQLLTDLKTIDGSGSGLDADLLDGHDVTYFAPTASPALTGTPTAPTAAPGTNTTQLATTEFVTVAGNSKANNSDLLLAIGNINAPLFDLPLKNSLAMKSGVGNVTFTRASTATYIDRYGMLQVAGVDTPRFEKQGYLNEVSSTNLFTNSNQFDNWNLQNGTVTQNVTGPDGVANSAFHFYKTTTGAEENVFVNPFTLTAGTTYTASVYAKKAEDSFIRVLYPSYYFSDGANRDLRYNFDTKTFTDSHNNIQSKSVVELANGWVRISMTFTVTTTATSYANVIYSYSATDVAGNGVYIYGAQLEALPFATSYIPTTSSTATRAADILNFTRAGNIPNIETNGVISVLCDVDVLGDTGYNQWLWALYPSGSDHIGMLVVSGMYCYSSVTSTTESSSISGGAVSAKTPYRLAQVVSNAGHYTYKNGIQTGFKADTDGRITSTCNSSVSTVRIGSYDPTDIYGTTMFNGHISNFRVYDRALTAYEVSLA
jgi:hypothetical protein